MKMRRRWIRKDKKRQEMRIKRFKMKKISKINSKMMKISYKKTAKASRTKMRKAISKIHRFPFICELVSCML